jgi:PAS domain S-box-containing protein
MTDTAPVMVWMSGPDKRCTYFNKRWLDFTGRPVEREMGDGWSEGVHPDDLQRCLNTYVRAFDARREFRMEYRLRRSDGEYRWILDTGVPRFDAAGAFEGYIGSCIDITDQKHVQAELRESEARLRFLLESTNAIPWVADAQSWLFTYVGPQATRLLGYPMDAWFEKDFWANHIHPDDRAAAIAFCLEHAQDHSDFELEYRMVAADGRSVWIHDVVNVVHENGAARTLRGFLIDVTKRRQAEEESHALREQLVRVGRVSTLGQLAASIAHEVNQPLCAIVSNAQAVQGMLAAGRIGGDEMAEALQDIVQDGERASAIVTRIRAFLNKTDVEPTPVDINEVIREVRTLVRHEMARENVSVALELAHDLPRVLADRVQLQQVILNLMTNGAEAMKGLERPHRELIIRSMQNAQGSVTMTVQDAGVGIDPGVIDQVFRAFFTTKQGGLGMGLAICKTIIEAHRGKIWATRNAGRGTTFHVSLPGLGEPAS